MRGLAYLVAMAGILAVSGQPARAQDARAHCPPLPVCDAEQMPVCKFRTGNPDCGCSAWACVDSKVQLDLKLPSSTPRTVDDLPKPAPPEFEPPPIPPSVLEPKQPNLPTFKLDPPHKQ